jgi:hypothetical protein
MFACRRTPVQLCIVHMVRNSLRYVSWKHQKAVARAAERLVAFSCKGRGVCPSWLAADPVRRLAWFLLEQDPAPCPGYPRTASSP